MVDAVGPKDAKILIIGDRPDFEDLQRNMPYVGKRGDVLRGELGIAGIDIRKCRITYVWKHDIVKDCKGHMGEAMREMVGKPYVLLIGAETSKTFGIEKADLRIGLPVESVFFPPDVKVAIVVTNPPQSSAVGEFRLALSKFARRINE